MPDTEELLSKMEEQKTRYRTFGKRKSAMAEIGTETEQREQFIAETEQRIAELEQQIEKGGDIDERIQRTQRATISWKSCFC